MKMSLKSLRWLAGIMLVLSIGVSIKHGAALGSACLFVGGAAVASAALPYRRSTVLHNWTGVSLAEIFIPEVYNDIVPNNSPDLTAFSQSGVAVTNQMLQDAAQSGVRLLEVPMWNDLDHTAEPNYSDDTDTNAVPGNVDTDSWKARNGFMNKAYGVADLAAEIGKSTPGNGDPMTRIKNRFGAYWAYQFQNRIIAVTRGIMLANIAQDGGDMVKDVSIADGNAATGANKISADNVIDAVFTMGDHFDQMQVIAMHSVIYQNLLKQQLIVFVRDAEGTLLYASYLGKRVVIDDGLTPVAGGTSGFVYTTVIFGNGAIGYGEGTPTVPSEVYRLPLGGNGGGLESIIERKTWLIHPLGFDWTDTTIAGKTATLAELKTAANWNRAVPRKLIPLAYLKTNG